MILSANNRILTAIQSLQGLDRRKAASLIREEMKDGSSSGDRWGSINRLCRSIGETAMAVEAAKRLAATQPHTLDRILFYVAELVRCGRFEDATEVLCSLPKVVRAHTGVLHLQGVIASHLGRFEEALDFYHQVLGADEATAETWLALSTVKIFSENDPDLLRLLKVSQQANGLSAERKAQIFYAMGKALRDVGDVDAAAQAFLSGSRLMQSVEPYDRVGANAFCQRLIGEFTPEAMRQLKISNCKSNRVIFVNGLPRSGTTLIEQILSSHSSVADGAELNLFQPAALPTGDYSMKGALAYQARHSSDDPWRDIAEDYLELLINRFGLQGRVVDKTLNQSRFIGLIMHALPEARLIWVRRNAEDCALSAYTTFFPASVPWSWSFYDMAAHFAQEDLLYRHWSNLFPERILTVPYEQLVASPEEWTIKIMSHVGLAPEPQVFTPHQTRRAVMTASVAQVRSPITTSRVGVAKNFEAMLAPFRQAYTKATNEWGLNFGAE